MIFPLNNRKEVDKMSKMMVFHNLPSAIPVAQADAVAKVAKALSNADAYWVSSWVQADDKGDVAKIICEWDAKDAETLGKVLQQMGAQIPNFSCDGPYPMMKVEGETYR